MRSVVAYRRPGIPYSRTVRVQQLYNCYAAEVADVAETRTKTLGGGRPLTSVGGSDKIAYRRR